MSHQLHRFESYLTVYTVKSFLFVESMFRCRKNFQFCCNKYNFNKFKKCSYIHDNHLWGNKFVSKSYPRKQRRLVLCEQWWFHSKCHFQYLHMSDCSPFRHSLNCYAVLKLLSSKYLNGLFCGHFECSAVHNNVTVVSVK